MTETTQPAVSERPKMDDLLNKSLTKIGSPKQEEKPAPAPKEEAKEAPKEEKEPKDGEKVQEEGKEEKTVPLEALHEARMKNRKLRAEIDEIKRQQAAQKTDDGDDYYTDGETPKQAAPTDLEHKVLDRLLVQSCNTLKRELGKQESATFFDDFDKACDQYDESVPEGGVKLFTLMYNSDDPYEFIKETVENYRAKSKYGTTPTEWEQKIRAEVEAEVRQEMKGELKDKQKLKEALPKDVGGSRAASGGTDVYNRPTAQQSWNSRNLSSRLRGRLGR
jgi:hypothetical protein